MKKLQLLLFTLLLSYTSMGQWVTITADSLLHHLQQSKDIYACFDDDKKDPVVINFYAYGGLYFNDTLKHLLINLYNDSIGWARYKAKVVRQNLEKESEEYKRNGLQGYLQRNYNKSFADSVLNNKQLFAQYFDSLCVYEEESSFDADMKKGSTWNVPNSLIRIITYSRYPELYDKMYYGWNKTGRVRNYYYDYLFNVDCPEVISIIESSIDNNKYNGIGFLDDYRSEAIRLLIKALDKTYLVPMNLSDFSVPLNVKCLGFTWLRKYNHKYRFGNYTDDIEKITFKIIDDIWLIMERDCTIKPTEKEWRSISKEIIDNKPYIIKFLEQHYQKCLNAELYWKQNMPYYKKE